MRLMSFPAPYYCKQLIPLVWDARLCTNPQRIVIALAHWFNDPTINTIDFIPGIMAAYLIYNPRNYLTSSEIDPIVFSRVLPDGV